ncbi:hypothetical protein SANT12839_100500 [Streptomyces antimycoticus]|uniref:Uncharacterized protein n=1 Tax=Streptomyces antimycoticus TaxID=68175 RepID=A0A4D4KRU0_9ACTN|nr:hypothetical protein SANT12839_100500 [Streptomyces antimycoticus]
MRPAVVSMAAAAAAQRRIIMTVTVTCPSGPNAQFPVAVTPKWMCGIWTPSVLKALGIRDIVGPRRAVLPAREAPRGPDDLSAAVVAVDAQRARLVVEVVAT